MSDPFEGLDLDFSVETLSGEREAERLREDFGGAAPSDVDPFEGFNLDFSAESLGYEPPSSTTPQPVPVDKYGLPPTKWDNDETLANLLEDQAAQTDRRVGVSKLAQETGTPFEYVDKHYDQLQKAAQMQRDPAKFRREHLWLYNMIIRNPWAAETVTRQKDVTAVSSFLHQSLNPDISSIAKGFGASIFAPALPVLFAHEMQERVQKAALAEPGPAQEYEVGVTAGETGWFAPSKYVEALYKGTLSSGIPSIRNAIADIPDLALPFVPVPMLMLMGEHELQKMVTGFDLREKIRAPHSDLAALGNMRMSNDKAIFDIKEQLKDPDLNDLLRTSLERQLEELKDERFSLDKSTVELQRKVKPADWGEGAVESLFLESMQSVTSQGASLTGMGGGAFYGGIIGSAFGPGGTVLGARIGGLLGGFTTTFLLERGNSWHEMRGMVDDNGDEIPVDVLYGWNTMSAIAKALVETGVNAFFVFRSFGPAGDFMLSNNTRAATRAALANKGMYAAFKDMGQRWLKATGSEGAEEFIQQGFDIIAQWGARSQSQGSVATLDVDRALAEMTHAGLVGAIGGGLIGGAGVSFQIAQMRNQRSKAKRAGALAAGVEHLSHVEGVKDMPVEFSTALRELALRGDRPIEDIFINPLRLQEVAQEKGVNLDEAMLSLLGRDGVDVFNKAITEAEVVPQGDTKATLRIPLESFVKNWSNIGLTEGLAGDITTATNTLTLREVAQEQIEAQRTLFETLKTIENLDEQTWEPESDAERRLYKVVEEGLRRAAEPSKDLDANKVKRSMLIYRSLARVAAVRLNYSTEEMLEYFALQFAPSPTMESPAHLEARRFFLQNTILELEKTPEENAEQLNAAKQEYATVSARIRAVEAAEDAAIMGESVERGPIVETATEGEALEIAERITDSMVEIETGPSLNAEVAHPPVLEQAHNFWQWVTRQRAWMDREGYSKKEIEAHIGAMRGQIAILSSLSPVTIDFLPRTQRVVGSEWSHDLVSLYNKYEGDFEAMKADIANIEDEAARKKLSGEFNKKTKERLTVEWPVELDAIAEQADGNTVEMKKLIKKVEDKELRKTMFTAVKDAEKPSTVEKMTGRIDKKTGLEKDPEDVILKGFGIIRANADPIYKISFDASAMCRKRLEAAATMGLVQKRLNEKLVAEDKEPRALRENELMALANLFRIAGKEAPCLYCYVEAPRAAAAPMLNNAIKTALGEKAMVPTWADSTKALAQAAIDEINERRDSVTGKIDKETLPSPSYWIDTDLMQNDELREKWEQFPALFNFAKQTLDNAKINKPKVYSEYWGQFLKLDQTVVDYMREHAGFRFFSSSDFQFEHVFDLIQALNDLALREATAHAYTKVLEFIEIFGSTNMKIQTSLFAQPAGIVEQKGDEWILLKPVRKGDKFVATDEVLFRSTNRKEVIKHLNTLTPDGGFVQDTLQGMDWKKAQKFRKKYDHVGTVFIATSEAQIWWALDNDDIDFIIPFHASGMKKDMFEKEGYINFESTQEETWEDPEGKSTANPKKIRMHELGAADGVTDEQMTETYLKLCKERGIKPVFPKFQSHPKFAKLKKDYARSDTPFLPIRTLDENGESTINLKAADKVLNQYFDFAQNPSAHPTMPTARPDEKIAGQLVDLVIDNEVNHGPDPADVTRAIIRGMPASAARQLAQVQDELVEDVVGPVREQQSVVQTVFDPRQVKSATGNVGTFDPTSPSIVEQSGVGKTPRGYMRPVRNAFKKTFRIFLGEQANVSTPLHEMAHAYLEMLDDIINLPPPQIESRVLRGKQVYELRDSFTGNVIETFDNAAEAEVYVEQYMPRSQSDIPTQVKHDYGAIMSWVGAKSYKTMNTEQNEMFARGFEKYLLEGKAPSVSLIRTFAKIRAWLMKIYSALRDLDVELDDSIRGVFDRMLATDEEIDLMRKASGIDIPLYTSAKQMGVTKKEFEAYLDDREDKVTRQVLQAQRLAAEAHKSAVTAEWRKELAKNKEIATAEYERQPAARASLYIRKGQLTNDEGKVIEGPVPFSGKLNHDAARSITGRFSPVWRSIRSATIKEDGLNPDDVAEFFLFGTGKEMLEAIAVLPPKAQTIRERADQLTTDAFPQMKEEMERLDEVVGKALHMEGTTEALLREWRNINTKAGRGSTQQLAIETYAKNLVAKLGVNQLRPTSILQKEVRYAEQSTAAAAQGDFNKAADLKMQQLINHFMYREVVTAKQEIAKDTKFAKKLTSTNTRKKLGLAGTTLEDPRSAYLDVVDSITEGLGLVRLREQVDPRLDVGALVTKMESDGAVVAFEPDAVRGYLQNPKPLKALNVRQFREVMRALKNIARSAARKNFATVQGKKLTKEESVELLLRDGEENMPDLSELPSTDPAAGITDKVKKYGREASSWLLRQSTMIHWLADFDISSIWHDIILRPLREAEKKKVELTREIGKPIVDALDAIPNHIRTNEKIDGVELFPNHKAENIEAPTRRWELLVMALNIGTAGIKDENGVRDGSGNFERLTQGRNITEEEVMNALEILTLAEWRWVQAVWDANVKLWEKVRALEMRDTGIAPEQVPHHAFSIETSDGHIFETTGGYVPAVYDGRSASNRAITLGNDAGSLRDPTFVYPGTSKGHTQSRVKHYTNVISLDPNLFRRGIDQVIHDLSFREPVRQVANLVLDSEVQAMLKRKLGKARTDTFVDWLRNIGANGNEEGLRPPEGMQKLRSHAATGILGHRLKTMLGDAANFFSAMPKLGPKYWFLGFTQYFSNPLKWKKFAEEHRNKSTFLSTARSTLENDFNLVAAKLTRRKDPFSKAYHFYRDSAWWGFEQTFNLTAYPMWNGAYQMYKAEGMSDEDAAYAADDFCGKYFPSQTGTEKSRLQRDKGMVGFMMLFSGYLNSVYQVNADAVHKLQVIWKMTQGHHGQKVWKTSKALPAIAGQIVGFWTASMVLGELFTGRGPEDDEEIWEWYSRKLMMGPIAPLPFVGYSIESWLMGKTTSIRGAPGLATFDDVLKAMSGIVDDRPDAMMRAMKAAGFLVGMPVSPLDQIDYLFSKEGLQRDIDQADVLGMIEGVAYGRRKPWTPHNLLSPFTEK